MTASRLGPDPSRAEPTPALARLPLRVCFAPLLGKSEHRRNMLQHLTRRAVVVLAGGSAILAIGTASTATDTAVAATSKSTRTTLVRATFDKLPTGRVTPKGFNSQLHGTNNNTAAYDDMAAVRMAGHGKVLRTKFDAGSYHTYPAGNNGGTFFIPLPRVVNNACMRYNIRFDSKFDWSLGGKLPGLEGVAPGVAPSAPTGGNYAGSQGWSGRLMWLGPKAYSWAGPVNQAVSYMYNPRQTTSYGDNVRWDKAFVAGRWHTVKVCYRMNTVGHANGRLRSWMDGVKVVDNTSYVYRSRSDVGISHIAWHVFRGGDSSNWAGSRTSYIYIDNVRITTIT